MQIRQITRAVSFEGRMSFEDRMALEAERARAKAQTMPPGKRPRRAHRKSPSGRDGAATQRVAQIAKIEVAVTCDLQKLARRSTH
jgi:hypothetical protein